MITSTDLIVKGTPWDEFEHDGVLIHVKREDLCALYPGPSFSKLRGVEARLRSKQDEGVKWIGVLDTVHSKAGWGVSWLCSRLSLQCINFYPVYKGEIGLRPNQEEAARLGALLIPLQAGRSFILYQQARKQFERYIAHESGYMMPNALKLWESVDETAQEVVNYTPKELQCGTWIVSISSGTIGAGVVKGLLQLGVEDRVSIVFHMGYSRKESAVASYIFEAAGGWLPNTYMVDEGYEYKDLVTMDEQFAPFPCNPYYDLKAWLWTLMNVQELEQPIIFWNIGA